MFSFPICYEQLVAAALTHTAMQGIRTVTLSLQTALLSPSNNKSSDPES